MKRHVLFLVRNFPPLRTEPNTARIVKHLGRDGWRVDVLHSRPGWGESRGYLTRDEALLEQLGDNVHPHPVTTPNLLRGVEQLLRRLAGGKGRETSGLGSRTTWRRGGGLRGFYHSLTILPDGGRPWMLRCPVPALRLIRRLRPSLLVTSGPPFSTHLGGCWIKSLTGIPWVAWFRDLYTDNPLYVEWSPWRRGFDRALERRVVGYADAVVTVYPETTELLRRRCARPGQLYRTIRNGYDEEIFAEACGRIEAERSDNKLVLLHGGTLAYTDRDGQTAHALLEGLRRWLDVNPAAADTLRLELVGKGATAYGERVAELGLEDVVTLEPAVPLHRITERQLAADILLVILEDSPTNRVITGGKIYECLRAGKPILGLMHPDSSAARLIEGLNAGSVAPYGDAAAIARTLDKLHAGVTSGGFAYGGPARDEFVRRTSFTELAAEHIALYTALLRARGLA